jgi:transcription antitermination factor NusG
MTLNNTQTRGLAHDASAPFPWYALQVRTRYERVVAEHLSGRGFEWFLPLRKDRKRWSDRMKEIESPLFPGYLFCRFDTQNRLPILQTPGVVQIVGYNRQPISVDEVEIAAIQTLVAAGVPNQPCSFVEIGDRVRIGSGPLRGLEGILVESRGKHKFVLSVTLLQRSVAVEIDSVSVIPAGDHVAPARCEASELVEV